MQLLDTEESCFGHRQEQVNDYAGKEMLPKVKETDGTRALLKRISLA